MSAAPRYRRAAILAASLSCACEAAVASVSVSEQQLIGGTLDEADPAVVGLLVHGQFYCTGTLIAGRTVVTAAHCIGQDMPDSVFFGSASHIGGRTVEVAAARAHPLFVAETPEGDSAHDIGALLLATDPPAEAQPIEPLDPADAAALTAGAALRLVGFGGESPIASAAGIKRTGMTTIDEVREGSFVHRADPARICSADSGGPALLTIDGIEYLAGVAAGGDPDCTDYGVHTRLDVHIDDFLRHFPEPTAELGERCSLHGNCVSGLCLESSAPDGFAYCSAPCRSDSDCPDALRCVRDPAGARMCRHADPQPGALGSACDEDGDCTSFACGRSADGGGKTCTIACTPDDAVACPDGHGCAVDVVRASLHGCFLLLEPDQTVDASAADPDAGDAAAVHAPQHARGASGGCSVAARLHPLRAAGATWSIALLFLLCAARRARSCRLTSSGTRPRAGGRFPL